MPHQVGLRCLLLLVQEDNFYRLVTDGRTRKATLHWSLHPRKARGLSCLWPTPNEHEKGDRGASWSPEEKLTSPWYEGQCKRRLPSEIAQELDIDFLGSAYQFFDQEFIRVLIKEYCVPYLMRGRIAYESETLDPYGFELDDHGPLFLWFNLAGDGSFLTDRSYFEGKRFGLGSDVSHGTGASNSVTSVVNLVSGRKVALWKDPKTDPLSFAEETIALW